MVIQKMIQELEEIIKRDFKVDPEGGALLLKESQEKGYPVTVLKKNGAVLVYNFDVKDSNNTVFPIFNARIPKLTTIADYIVFYPHKDETLFVFICNLKSKNTTGASDQAQASWLLSEYIVKTVERLLNFPDNIKVEYRSLIFTTNPHIATLSLTNIKKNGYPILVRSGLKSIILKAGEACSLDALCV